MNCPSCSVPLAMSTREGIEIDYCPKCRGVWLDRGELDKIIERSTREEGDDERIVLNPPPTQQPRGQAPAQPPVPPPAGYGQPGYGQPGYGQPGYGQPGQGHPHPPRHGDPDDSDYGGYRYEKKKKSIWRELLDF